MSSRAVLVSAISAAAFFPSGMLLAWSIDDRLYHRAGAEISLLYSAALAIIGFVGFVMASWFAERGD